MPDTFQTQDVFPGIRGLDLYRATDEVDPLHLIRMTNVIRNEEGEITTRPGLTSLFNLASSPSSTAIVDWVARIAIPSNLGLGSTFDYYYHGDGFLYASLDAAAPTSLFAIPNYPITSTIWHPPADGTPWLILGSPTINYKVQIGTHTFTSLGLPIPLPPTLSIPSITYSSLETFDSTTGFVANAGSGGAPTLAVDVASPTPITGLPVSAFSLKVTTNNGGVGTPYYNFVNKATTLNMATNGSIDWSDEDIIHVFFKFANPAKILEVRLYFVCSASFDTATLPGSSSTLNTEAYVKVFRPSDFQSSTQTGTSTTTASSTAAANAQIFQQLSGTADDRLDIEMIQGQLDSARWTPKELLVSTSWQELGVVGLPLRRSEFRRIGSDNTRTWANVSGICMFISTTDSTSALDVWFDSLILYGGSGPDTADFGLTAYDYRITNYDPRTGAESNPSDIMADADFINSIRTSIVVDPLPSGTSALRQRIYRRGGTITDGWYLIDTNTSDGGSLTDTLADLDIRIPTNILQFDNDQAVTTVDRNGNTVLNAPLRSIFGPVNGLLFGCGDSYRPGWLYWCKLDNPDSWPADFSLEICSPEEELIHGVVISGQAYVFSKERQYSIIPNIANVSLIAVIPTACTHGAVGARAVCVAAGVAWFVSYDGIYGTVSGQAEKSITADSLAPLFNNETRNGYAPIDFSHPELIELTSSGNELYFTFFNKATTYSTFIYNIIYKYWRHAFYTPGIMTFSDATPLGQAGFSSSTGMQEIIAGGANSTKLYKVGGYTDDGVNITTDIITPYFHQGLPRQDKLYGDIVVDAIVPDSGITFNVTPQFNFGNTPGTTVALTGTANKRQRQYVDTGATQAQNMAIELTWTGVASPTTLIPATAFKLSYSTALQTDTTVKRVTDWESGGRLSDKYVKGIIIECDTAGVDKTLSILGDGSAQASITVNANGRQVVEKSFTQFRARLLRIAPTDTVPWKNYSYSWIFDEEPLSLTRWETQPLTSGLPGSHSLLWSNIMILSTTDVTLSITSYRQDGTSALNTYTITSSAGVKQKFFVPFNANKGIMHKYVFTSASAFYLYRQESEVMVQPWGGQPVLTKPFGDEDLDLVRSLNSAEFIASRSGWALGNKPRPATMTTDSQQQDQQGE